MAGQDSGNVDPSENVEEQNLDGETGSTGQEDTQQSQSTPPSDDGAGHGEGKGDPSKSAPSDEEGQPDDDLANKRAVGKLKQLQKKYQEAQKDLKRLKTIEQRAMQSPEKFRRALVDFNGWSEQDAQRYVQDLKQRGVWQQQRPQGQGYAQQQQGIQEAQNQFGPNNQQPTVDPYEAAERVFQHKQQAQKLQQDFFSRVPELHPDNVPPEKKPAMKSLVTSIEYEARRRVQENPDADFVDELVNVYKDFTGKTDEELKKAREAGRRQGYLEANSSKAGSTKPSSSKKAESNNYGLTPEQLKQAKEEGLTPKEFHELTNNPVSVVE
jgi:hypothetical protein